ncbi:MAG TPA: nucleotidyltransferase [Flavobacteriales bacterium]|nr:nucleotidyltransferase [Flavobacteriales bacterium]
MKIIVPMAGMGKRMRPHTLTVPKPLLPVAGKPIVQRLVEGIAKLSHESVDEVAFIIGDFGAEVEKNLIDIAESLGAKGSIYHQDEALGTAHAVYCAKECLSGKVIVAFADTLFYADFDLDEEKDAIIWVEKVSDPSAFGVVKLAADGSISELVEKPETFVSDLAIIGIYYFRDGENLRDEIKYLLDNDIKEKGEYQLTNVLENMNAKGKKLYPGKVDEWLDCGNKNATVYTNQRVLSRVGHEQHENLVKNNSVIIEPCFIGKDVKLNNSIVGPHVSIGNGCSLDKVIVENSIIQTNSRLNDVLIRNSMIGNFVEYSGSAQEVSLGDYNEYS